MTGSTGRMHGEIPVTSPPMSPIRARVSTAVVRSPAPFGLASVVGNESVTVAIRLRPLTEPRVFEPSIHMGEHTVKRSIRRGTLAIGVAFIAFLGTACASSDDGASGDDNAAAQRPAAAPESSSDSGMSADPAADLVGPGC